MATPDKRGRPPIAGPEPVAATWPPACGESPSDATFGTPSTDLVTPIAGPPSMKRHDTRQAGPRGIQPLTTTLLQAQLVGVEVLEPYPWAEAPSSP